MQLTILGGGGFRVPLVYLALQRARPAARVSAVVLHDIDAGRLAVVERVLRQLAGDAQEPPAIRTTTDLDEALAGAGFVFSAIRVGGLQDRTSDERVALDLGVLGQETTGPGGIAYGLRTVPVARHIAERVAVRCPEAWVVNFTNPAGMITEAMQQVLGERVIGVCDSPSGLHRRAARAAGLPAGRTTPDYAGLNHLGWLRGLRCDGRDVLPAVLADDLALGGIEEGRLFGADWIRALNALPNEYLYYYYFTREAIRGLRGGAGTRGEFLLRQQSAFYAVAVQRPETASAEWHRVRRERDASYLAESRPSTAAAEASDRAEDGGYEHVALALLEAVTCDTPTSLILNVRNGSAIPGLPSAAVVEVPCRVDASGAHPLATAPLTGAELGLVQQVKAVEQLTISAAMSGSAATAVSAFALHPLVDSVSTARLLLEGYRARIPSLAAVLR